MVQIKKLLAKNFAINIQIHFKNSLKFISNSSVLRECIYFWTLIRYFCLVKAFSFWINIIHVYKKYVKSEDKNMNIEILQTNKLHELNDVCHITCTFRKEYEILGQKMHLFLSLSSIQGVLKINCSCLNITFVIATSKHFILLNYHFIFVSKSKANPNSK